MFPIMKRLCLGVKAVQKNSVLGLVKTWIIDICKSPLPEKCNPIPVPTEIMKVLDFSH